jgi:hypothetical protein
MAYDGKKVKHGYVQDSDGNIVWFGPAISELNHWKEHLRKANAKIEGLEEEIKELKNKIARYAEFETPEWKAMVVETERAYASRLGHAIPKDIAARVRHE